jgi:membrane-bound metal-dependent hydrolase YbcI (DUF457 family)
MYPPGHIALGYFAARATSSVTKERFNLYVMMVLSVSPDFDLLIPFLTHRGPTHSLIAIILFLVPVLLLRREWLPYVAGFGSHALIGDLLTGTKWKGGCMLLWPYSSSFVDLGSYIEMGSAIEMGVELILFTLMIIFLIRSNAQNQQ